MIFFVSADTEYTVNFMNSSEFDCEQEPLELNCTDRFYYNPVTRTCRPLCIWTPYITTRTDYATIQLVFGLFSFISLMLISLSYIICAFSIQRHL